MVSQVNGDCPTRRLEAALDNTSVATLDRGQTMKRRCEWCGSNPLYVAYHDEEWGVPVHKDQRLFEMLTLEGAQAGLSWLTILKKREEYRKAFGAFDPERVAVYSEGEIESLLANPGIVRNRLKINSVIGNARGVLKIREEFGSLDSFLWRYVDGMPRQNAWTSMGALPTRTDQSDKMSKDLKATRVQLCRLHHLLCLHAGRRKGE
jgi:DNA-3-methyladenine glycosylase I